MLRSLAAIFLVVELLVVVLWAAQGHAQDFGQSPLPGHWVLEGTFWNDAPAKCCGPKDCHPIDPKRVRETSKGYVVDGSKLLGWDRVFDSRDHNFWYCASATSYYCIFVPRGGV